MAAWQSGFIEVAGISLHYTRTGGDKPPMVLAHGVSDDGLCWTAFAQAFEAHYDLIMLDARGHGRSGEATAYDSASQAGDLAGLITGLGLHQPLVLGHSMGAMTTLALAALYPALPQAIMLEDPPPWWTYGAGDSQERSLRRSQMRAGMLQMKRRTHAELIAAQRSTAPTWPDAEIQRWADSKQRFSPSVVEIFNDNVDTAIDWPRLLPQITCPTLLISGDPAHGALVTPESSRALQAYIPQLQVAQIPAAGHSIRHDQPELYMRAVREFLSGLPAA